MPELSIVLPTCQRADLLEACVRQIIQNTHVGFELIIVDGASTDDTPRVIAGAKEALGDRLVVIRETKREGFVCACNRGFRAARGEKLCWLNDDARPLPGALDLACRQLDAAGPDVGFVAMFHRSKAEKNLAGVQMAAGKRFVLHHVRGTLYANFPVGWRRVYERLGFFDERYYVCAADPDLSLKAWHAGLSVVPATGCLIDHDELDDDRRVEDSTRGNDDNRRLFDKWLLPDKNPSLTTFRWPTPAP